MPVPITLIRAHLNLDHDHDDELLTHYTDAAEAWVAAYTGQPFSRHSLETQAVLMLVAHLAVRGVATDTVMLAQSGRLSC